MSFQDQLTKSKSVDVLDNLIPANLKNTNNEQKDESLNMNTNTEHKNVSVNENTNNEQESVSVNNKLDSEDTSLKITHNSNESAETKVISIMSKYDEKANRLTVEDTHERYTFLMHKELKKRLNKLAKGKKRGYKTIVLNDALELMLTKLEELDK